MSDMKAAFEALTKKYDSLKLKYNRMEIKQLETEIKQAETEGKLSIANITISNLKFELECCTNRSSYDFEYMYNTLCLGLDGSRRDYTKEDYSKAFRTMSLLMHPDKIGSVFPERSKDDINRQMDQITKARDYLTQEQKDTAISDFKQAYQSVFAERHNLFLECMKQIRKMRSDMDRKDTEIERLTEKVPKPMRATNDASTQCDDMEPSESRSMNDVSTQCDDMEPSESRSMNDVSTQCDDSIQCDNAELKSRKRKIDATEAQVPNDTTDSVNPPTTMPLSKYISETGIDWKPKRMRSWCTVCKRSTASTVCLLCSPLHERSEKPICFCDYGDSFCMFSHIKDGFHVKS